MRIKENDFIHVNGLSVDVNIKLSEQKLNLLLGENGIGKSSFLNGLIEQFFEGAFCFQESLKSINSVRLCDLILSVKETEFVDGTLLDELIAKFELKSCLFKELNQISGGENQALKLALNLCRKEKVLIFDEPSQFLDDKKTQIFKDQLQIAMAAKTILIVEHNYNYLKELELNYLKMRHCKDRVELVNA